jgi:hypothetical protein
MIEKDQEISPDVLQEQFDALLNHTYQKEINQHLDNDIDSQNIHQVLEKMYWFQAKQTQLNIDLKTLNDAINDQKNILCKGTFTGCFFSFLAIYLGAVYYFSPDYKDAISYSLLGLLPFLATDFIFSESIRAIKKKLHFWRWKKREGGQEILDNYQNKKNELIDISHSRDSFCTDMFNENFYFQCLFAYGEMVSRIEASYPAEYLQDIRTRALLNQDNDREHMKKLYQSG